MKKYDYLRYLADSIKSVTVATVDSENKPVTMILDILDADETGIFFMTFKGKGLYNRLSDNNYIAISGMKGNSPSSMKAVSVRGIAVEIGRESLDELLSKNNEIAAMFPNGAIPETVTVFKVTDGTGEWIDTSDGNFDRAFFEF